MNHCFNGCNGMTLYVWEEYFCHEVDYFEDFKKLFISCVYSSNKDYKIERLANIFYNNNRRDISPQ